MAAYLISDVAPRDRDAWETYRTRAAASIAQYGGRYLVRGGTIDSLEGDWMPKSIVVVERDLLKLWIVTYGHDFGTANCEFRRHGQTRVGRQSHTWMCTREGWRIVAAHVSLLGEVTPMRKP